MKILVVDDDAELRGLIAFALRQAGYFVLEAPDGPSGLAAFTEEKPDLVLLDVNMPRVNGFQVLERIRAGGSTRPVMMLTVRSAEEDHVRGLDLGADDYITKPFSPKTLLARVRALLRRVGVEKPSPLATGAFVLDIELQTVRVRGGAPVRLTNLELRLIQFLLTNEGRPQTVDKLTAHVWGHRGFGDRQLLKQLVHRLRQKIERDPAAPVHLQTLSGVGYLFRADESATTT
jgi:DNA-binding response OmpR family regulator